MELTQKQRNKIKRALKALEDVRSEVGSKSDNQVMWYIESGGDFNLMNGDSHDERGDSSHENIIESFYLPNYDCGGW